MTTENTLLQALKAQLAMIDQKAAELQAEREAIGKCLALLNGNVPHAVPLVRFAIPQDVKDHIRNARRSKNVVRRLAKRFGLSRAVVVEIRRGLGGGKRSRYAELGD